MTTAKNPLDDGSNKYRSPGMVQWYVETKGLNRCRRKHTIVEGNTWFEAREKAGFVLGEANLDDLIVTQLDSVGHKNQCSYRINFSDMCMRAFVGKASKVCKVIKSVVRPLVPCCPSK